MTLNRIFALSAVSLAVALGLAVAGCGNEGHDHPEGEHSHDDGQDDGHDHGEDGDEGAHDDHADEVPLGTTTIGDVTVECAQGHGEVAPGKEMHLVVKLPYTDDGETTVRAWIGTEDRLASMVARAEYAPSHDDYDVHAVAPDPLPEGAEWWIEVAKPDGTTHVGSIALK